MTAMEWHYCAVCMGQGRHLEPAFGGYRWQMCDTCIGMGEVPNADTTSLAA